MKKSINRKVAGFLATCMALSILSPAMPVRAANFDDTVTITFNTGDGPRISNLEAPYSNWNNLTDSGSDNAQLSGLAGRLMTDPLQPLSKTLGPTEGGHSNVLRPQLPSWTANLWDGYEFDGWYTAATGGTKLQFLHPAFPYDDVTYYARWKGSDNRSYDWTINHKREMASGATWNFFGVSETSGIVVPMHAGDPVSTSFKRNIPGYKRASQDFAPHNSRRFGDLAGVNTGSSVGDFNASYVFEGTMPNDNLTVDYFYVPDDEQEFNYRVEHVSDTSNATLLPATNLKKVAEEPIEAHNRAAEIPGYRFKEAAVVSGWSGDLVTSGTFGVDKMVSSGDGFDASHNFAAFMPNQSVIIRYKYELDPTFQSTLTVEYVDNLDNDLIEMGLVSEDSCYITNPGVTKVITAPDLTAHGYLATVTMEWENLPTPSISGTQVSVVPQIGAGKLKVIYHPNYNDTSHWARLSFLATAHGTLTGNSSPRDVAFGNYQITADGKISAAGTGTDYTDLFVIAPDSDLYLKDGWYEVGPDGNKTGQKLTSFNVTGNKKLIFNFIEDPSKWCDISFVAGSHGSINNIAPQHTTIGSTWSQLVTPGHTANAGYMFIGWYDETGALFQNRDETLNPTFDRTRTYTARFEPIVPETGVEELNRPDAHGRIGSNGTGEITVADPAAGRKYVVTDLSGSVIKVLTATEISGGAVFDQLNIASIYDVYELSATVAAPAPGSSISSISNLFKSYPTRVLIPAIGDNTTVAPDSGNPGKTQIIIRPAAPNTEYALLDENGNTVYDWSLPTGSPLEKIFSDLDPNTNYTVLARSDDSNATIDEQKDKGNNIFTENEVTQSEKYVIETIGGTIVSVAGNALDSNIYREAEAGDQIRITAPINNSASRTFKEWKILVGTIDGFGVPSQRTRTITMPAKNVVLIATYEAPLGTPSNATVEYKTNSGHEGEVALDMSESKINNLRDALTTTEDGTLLTTGREVTYRVQFNKRVTKASESEAIKAEGVAFEDAYKAGWSLDIDLLRYVDGNRRPIEAGLNPGHFDVITQVDRNDLEHRDYQLWEIAKDGTVNQIAMHDSPDVSPDDRGIFSFSAKIDCTYVLSYSRTHTVTIKDLIFGHIEAIKMRKGETLGSNSDYLNWTPIVGNSYPDTQGNIWTYEGLSKVQNINRPYDVTEPVTKDMILYASYRSDDDEWNKAKDKLVDEIDVADDLMNNGSVSKEDKQRLEDAIRDANDLLNRLPNRPTTEELTDAYDTLHKLVEEIRNGGKPIDPPITPPRPGGGGGGGGGFSGTAVKPKASGYKTYTVGVDGNWELIDAANHKWIFKLTNGERISGTWAYVEYIYEGISQAYHYHFASDGIMDSGWFKDDNGTWYYLSIHHDGWFGRMITGWHHDPADRRWYYLDPTGGQMATDWKQVNGSWYYFTAANQAETWNYNDATQRWDYLGNQSNRPFGSMFVSEGTPDGYQVNADGVWNQ